MRYEVPQFIEIEDKIFGPFTWRQFIYLAGGVGGCLVLFFLPIPKLIFVLVGFPLMALSALLAFYKVNNRPFAHHLESMLRYITGTKLFLWQRQEKQVITHRTAPAVDAPKKALGPTDNAMQTLSRQLELNTLAPNELPQNDS